jgi:hypothetical protein
MLLEVLETLLLLHQAKEIMVVQGIQMVQVLVLVLVVLELELLV